MPSEQLPKETKLNEVEISVEQDAQATELFYDCIDDDEEGGYMAAREIISLRTRVQELEHQRDVTHDELVHRSNSR